MRLTLERFGGIAGVPAKPLVVDSQSLAAPRAVQLEALAREVLRETQPDPVQAPDSFGYELTIETEAERRVIAFDYAQASAALRELLTALRAH